MEHSETFEDYMGLADVVFPCFLFIVGMSVPLAIENRLARGDSTGRIAFHILGRTFALLLMGIFTVNLGSWETDRMGFSEPVYEILVVTGFFLCWNKYSTRLKWEKFYGYTLQAIGILLLIFLALIYRSKTGSDGLSHGLRIKWWGILGLIGWAYGLTSIIYLLFRKRLITLFLTWIFFILLNIAGHSGLFGMAAALNPHEIIPGNGAFQAFALAGLLSSLLISGKIVKKEQTVLFTSGILIFSGIVLIFTGLAINHFFIISKNLATPPWIFICSGIAIIFVCIFHWIIDINGKEKWFEIIKPAGVNTLTCYLIPYYIYSIYDLIHLNLPDYMITGIPGLIKTLFYSLIVIGITELLSRINIRLKI